MHPNTQNRSKPENILHSCKEFLSRRDFNSCRELAHRVPRSDPNVSIQVDWILAIADVLGAAENRVRNNHHAILQLPHFDAANRDAARQQFKTLVRLLDPNKNKFPFAEEALMRVREAWSVLSDPTRRTQVENEGPQFSGFCGGNAPKESNGETNTTSFWTMCPYCWYLHEYEKKYEDCSFRCGNCQRAFQGVAVKPPTPENVVEGKEQYYCYQVSLPLRYPLCGGIGQEFGGNGSMGFKKRIRIKTVANRVKMKGFVDPDNEMDSDAGEETGDVEFAPRNGEVCDGVH